MGLDPQTPEIRAKKNNTEITLESVVLKYLFNPSNLGYQKGNQIYDLFLGIQKGLLLPYHMSKYLHSLSISVFRFE